VEAVTRQRLSPQRRREQLLDIGAKMFAARPYESVLMEDIADQAGVTRRLMYRYFPTKRDFFAAIFQRASDQLLATTEPADGRTAEEQLPAALDAHIQYFIDNPRDAITVNRGALAGDPVIQAIIADELAVVAQRILNATGLIGHARQVAAVGIHGWLVFVRAVCVECVESQSISRAELTLLCQDTFRAVLDNVRTLTAEPEEN
jgi:AcrR family transcriptional regulator